MRINMKQNTTEYSYKMKLTTHRDYLSKCNSTKGTMKKRELVMENKLTNLLPRMYEVDEDSSETYRDMTSVDEYNDLIRELRENGRTPDKEKVLLSWFLATTVGERALAYDILVKVCDIWYNINEPRKWGRERAQDEDIDEYFVNTLGDQIADHIGV